MTHTPVHKVMLVTTHSASEREEEAARGFLECERIKEAVDHKSGASGTLFEFANGDTLFVEDD
jgi:hypothetical protein